MMLDRNVAAVSPSSVWRVLQEAGLSSKWTVPDGQKAHRMGFHQPTRAHDQWHTDFAYVNLRGTHYFFTSVLDGYSRYIVHWDLRASMTTDDVELVIQRALDFRREFPSPGSSPTTALSTSRQSSARIFGIRRWSIHGSGWDNPKATARSNDSTRA